MSTKKYSKFVDFESRNKTGRHIRITKDMVVSKAFKGLTPHAISLYLAMKFRYKGTPDSKTFKFTYSDGLKECGFHQRTFRRAIDNLIENGFIELKEDNHLRLTSNVYAFSRKWHEIGNGKYQYDPDKRKLRLAS